MALADALQRSTLAVLDLSGNDVGNSGAFKLAEQAIAHATLKKLDLSGNPPSVGRLLAALFMLNREKKAKIEASKWFLTDNDVAIAAEAIRIRSPTALDALNRLNRLKLAHNQLSDVGVAALCTLLVGAPSTSSSSLKLLDLSHNYITDIGAATLATLVRSSTTLR